MKLLLILTCLILPACAGKKKVMKECEPIASGQFFVCEEQ